MRWTTWLVVGLVVLNAGWMLFDGARALIVGDYVTPSSGRHAGQLGPWSKVVGAVGLGPRSVPVKLIFVVYGAAFLAVLPAWIADLSWAPRVMIVLAVLGLWYVPFGTLINLIVIVLLVVRMRGGG